MELIEMLLWLGGGFVPSLGLGNIILSRLEKRKEKETIPWEI